MKTNRQNTDKSWRLTLWAGGITACVNLALILVIAFNTNSWSTGCDAACQDFFRNAVVIRELREVHNDRLARWNKPIRVVVLKETKSSPINLEYLFSDITYSTGHDISGYQNGNVNFIIVLTDDVFETVEKYDKFFDDLFSLYGKKEGQSSYTFLSDTFGGGDPCFGRSIVGGGKRKPFGIYHAMVFADFSKNHEDVERCLLQRIIRFLGIYDADKNSTDAIVLRSPTPRLTDFGKTIFANVYRDDIRSGDDIDTILAKLK